MSASLPAEMDAVTVAKDKTTVISRRPLPEIANHQVLVKVSAITLNPTDWKHRGLAPVGPILGCDFAGKVVQLGKDVDLVKIGDTVAGFVHGGKYQDVGSFAQYVKTDAELIIKVPQGVEVERAASVGIGGYTASQALFQRLGLSLPTAQELPSLTPESPQLLIWAASTSVGQWAVQLARAAGYHVIATASAKNHALLKKMGASEVYDYRDQGLAEKISKEHPNLNVALDCISEHDTQTLTVRSLGTKSAGKVVVLLKPEKSPRQDVEIVHTLIYTSQGKAFTYGKTEFTQAQCDIDRQFILQFANADKGLLYTLLEKKLINGNRIRIHGNGLDSIDNGLTILEKGGTVEKLAVML